MFSFLSFSLFFFFSFLPEFSDLLGTNTTELAIYLLDKLFNQKDLMKEKVKEGERDFKHFVLKHISPGTGLPKYFVYI